MPTLNGENILAIIDYEKMLKEREGLTEDDLKGEIALRMSIDPKKITNPDLKAAAERMREQLLSDPDAVKADVEAQGINPCIVDIVLPDLLATVIA